MIIELHRGPLVGLALFVQALGREAWLQWLPRGEEPYYTHPQGKRWGTVREGRNLRLYAGPLLVITARTGADQATGEYSV